MASDGSCEGLAATLQAKISTSSPIFSATKCCIYRVPPLLRQHNEKAYTPAAVSIGPLHHNDSRLLPMESHKLPYLQSFLRHSPPNMNLSSYLRIVKGLETDLRRCYADPIHLSSDDFIQMVLIDSVFLIELFWWDRNPDLGKEDDYIFRRPFIKITVARDIMLEENQLPFFVLVQLCRAAFKSDASPVRFRSFTELACKFLQIDQNKIAIDPVTKEATSCCHLLDLLRSHYKPDDRRTNGDCRDPDHHANACINICKQVVCRLFPERPKGKSLCPPVTSLAAAGVKFLPDDSPSIHNSSNLLQICSFDKKKGILKIPKLEVSDVTEYLFRNLVAFEQCHYQPDDTFFCNYCCLLDELVDTPEDVRLLVKEGVIENWLGSNKQVSDIINSLGDNVTINRSYYDTITQQLISHCDKRTNSYKATLRQKYFNSPWAAISVISAAILLLLTVIQVVTGILAIPHGK